MSKLGIKIFLIMLSVAIMGLVFIGLYLNYSIPEHFKDYLYLEKKEKIENLVSVLENNYKETRSLRNSQRLLSEFSRINNVNLKLTDARGNIIYSSTPMPGRMMKGYCITPFRRRIMVERNYPLGYEAFNLSNNNQTIGKLYWLRFEGPYIPIKSSLFVRKINRAIIFSAIIIAIITMVFSYFLSRYLTKPLIKINNVAKKVADGQLDHHVTVKGNDEIKELATSFNQMVAKLKYLETVRRKSTSDLAHELRTPLTNIKGYLEGIKEGVLEVDSVTLTEIDEEINRLIRLINRLNDLATAEKYIIQGKKKKIKLANFLEDLLNSYLPQAREKQIDLIKKYNPEQSIFIDSNEDALRTIFGNLINNSLKYTPEGGKIEITLSSKKNQAIISVKDNGTGISAEDLPYIFERFYRADKSRSTRSGGTGIGLTITRELVNSIGGKIIASSEGRGKGATFTVYLPSRNN
ncbi:HAMP domain-containing sensor histidine kinase [Halothermothrix orenii]|uniref:histidine kinase n=1 Tax=Halothermothrix orenii (strain H 168 / OCM 544 / DSM 9562) TaxID=373903 RepID=B8CXR0_HALOH|nr:HAMP domain-containing sensor histidine kinase [Halothermothrix orenii]ACL70079.1 integral membrane sensor signal transduction histidine kinase [Halothermothrix orenii H 168]